MPAASSKPTSQNLDSEAQDPVKLLIGALEKKARNLEKRKTKLETYKEMVNNGKSLNKDQEEAVSHYQEVQGNLNFAREFLGTIQTLITETSKAKKKHEKRESQQRQELEMQRIQDILLLQNVLNQMGQDHIRNDFLAGTNGAEQLEEKDLTFLDEFYTIVNPSRESEEGEETEKTEKKSFDEKMAEAAVHLDKFLKLDESEVCGTTYKYLKLLVQRIHKCGYLDKVPEPPAEEPEPPAPAPPTAAVVPEDVQDEPEDTENTEVEEDYSPSVLPTSHTVVSNEVSGFSQSSQQQEVLTQPPVADIPNPPEPIEMPPPKSSYTHDVNDVLAPVQGGVTFLQESVVDVDSPHLDPAVVAVSLMPSQSYMSAAFQSTADSSSMDHQVTPSSQMDQPGDSLRQSSQTDNVYASQPDQVYSQNIYDSQQTLIGNTQQSMPSGQHEYTSQQNLPASSQHDFTSQQSMPANQHDYTSQQNLPAAQHDYTSQQNLQSSQQSIGQQGLVSQQQSMGQPGLVSQQGYIDQTNFGSQAGMNTGPVGLGGSQPSLSSGPSQTDYSGSHQPLSGNTSQMDQSQSVGYNATGTQNMSDLRDFRNSPIDPQLTKPEDQQSSTSANSYQPGSLQTASSQYTSSDLPSTDGFGQTLQGTSQLSTDVSSMGTSGGNVTPPQSIPFPNEQSAATTQGLNKDSLEETSSSSSSSLPKSTMNAAAPPFQSSARTSPHMQTIQGTTPEDPTFSQSSSLQPSADDQTTVKKTEDARSTEFRNSPPNLDSSYQYQAYPNNYSRNNRGSRGGRGGVMGSPGYRNARGGGGGMPFIRNQPRFNNTNIQRGAYNPGYMPPPRDNFQPRTPDMGYTQGAAYNTFNRPQEQGYYRGRGGITRGAPRGGRGGTNIRGGQTQYRGRSGYQKPGTPITAN